MTSARRPLKVLVADGTMEKSIGALLARGLDRIFEGCRPIDFDPRRDLFYDPGSTDGAVHRRAHFILQPFADRYEHALVLLDKQFGGELPAERVRDDILQNLRAFGWGDRAEVVVIDPELEVWLWQDNENVESAVMHRGPPSLRASLRDSGDWPEGQLKPTDPKGTLLRIMKRNRAGAPAVVYPRITGRVSVKRCKDSSFADFRDALQRWFPAEAP